MDLILSGGLDAIQNGLCLGTELSGGTGPLMWEVQGYLPGSTMWKPGPLF